VEMVHLLYETKVTTGRLTVHVHVYSKLWLL